MKYLVTGAAGFIGAHVAQHLLRRGETVIGVDNLNDYYEVSLKRARLAWLRPHTRFRFLEQDITDRAQTAALFANEQFDCVIHLAAQAGVRYSIENPYAYIDSNLCGFATMLEGCRRNRVSHLVYASSSSVYGANRTTPFAVAHRVDHPISLYAATKKANELLAHTYSHLYSLPTTGLRFFTVYGPWGRPDMAYFQFAQAIAEDREIKVYNHGNMERDFTYIDDVVDGVVRAADCVATPNGEWSAYNPDPATSAAPYRIYNLGNARPEKLLRFIEVIESCMGKQAKKVYMDMQPGDVVSTAADIQDSTVAIGFRPVTPIETGVAKFVEWFREYYTAN